MIILALAVDVLSVCYQVVTVQRTPTEAEVSCSVCMCVCMCVCVCGSTIDSLEHFAHSLV